MKFTLSWLKSHLDTKASIQEIIEKLTAIGLEVEEVQDRAEGLKLFTVAEILEAKPHPNADRLRVCQVKIDQDKIQQIVCGAPNARAGIKVVLAPVGSTVPANGMVIKAAKIRDVESNGMLCSATELGIGGDAQGIVELPESAKLGEPFAAAMGLDDVVIDVNVTPNRADALSVRGIARDLAAAGLGPLKPLEITSEPSNTASPIHVSSQLKNASYHGIYIKNVKNGQSPAWLKQRLEAIGLKSISALVDITNYLTFDLGRPLHVYDAGKLNGHLTLRYAKAGEKILALNDKEYTLSESMPVIADEKGIVALAGIIGGKDTGCSAETHTMFLEVAWFDPSEVALTGRALDITSDARYRFERGLDRGFLETGATKAIALIQELCGGEVSQPVIAGIEAEEKKQVSVPLSKIPDMLGFDITEKEIVQILSALGIEVKAQRDSLHCTIPSWRRDITLAEDIVEEVARIYGFAAIPSTLLPAAVPAVAPGNQLRIQQMRKTLAARGLYETVNFSFIPQAAAELFDGGKVKIANPISVEMDTMRSSILPSLLMAASQNQARGMSNVALFETAPIFREQEIVMLSGLRHGLIEDKTIHGSAREADWLDAKADVFSCLEGLPLERLTMTREAPSWYHPGKSGAVKLGKTLLGFFGELHPSLFTQSTKKYWDLERAVAFELFPDLLPALSNKIQAYQPFNLQALERDFAFLVDQETAVETMLISIRKAEKNLISAVRLFDLYQGKGVAEGKKSVAIKVTLQPQEKSLTEAEIEKISQSIIAQVEKETGATLRVQNPEFRVQ